MPDASHRLRSTLMVATAVPVLALERVADRVSPRRTDARHQRRPGRPAIRAWAMVLTVPLWAIVLLRGLFYPLLGSDDLEDSWGGPTLAGAWAVHLLISVAILLVGSFLLASPRLHAVEANRSPSARR